MSGCEWRHFRKSLGTSAAASTAQKSQEVDTELISQAFTPVEMHVVLPDLSCSMIASRIAPRNTSLIINEENDRKVKTVQKRGQGKNKIMMVDSYGDPVDANIHEKSQKNHILKV